MTDVPTKGLLPQLTDVLQELTDSHELLLFTLRSVRVEYAAVFQWADEHETPHTEFIDVADPRPRAVVKAPTATASNPHGTVPSAKSQSAYLMRAEGLALVDTTATTSIPAEDEIRLVETHAVYPTAHARPEASSVVQAEHADDESANRDYNYFDELDTRLVHLRQADPVQMNPEPSGFLSSGDRF